MIKINNITKKMGKNGLIDLSYTFEKGYVYGLIGPNGSGKTTMIKCIMDLYELDKGNIEITNVTKSNDIIEVITYMPDSQEYATELTLNDIAKFLFNMQSNYNEDKFYELLTKFKLEEKSKYSKLSKGQKMAFRVCLALSRDTDIYLFDEPLSGIDIVTRRTILEELITTINTEEKIVIISTHELNDIERFIDKLVVLQEGKITDEYDLDSLKSEINMPLEEWYIDKYQNKDE